ncbi:MAG: ABC transporter substrate-binding protein [Promethearchaeota archaeon]
MLSKKTIAIFVIAMLTVSFINIVSPAKSEPKQETLVFWTTETEAQRQDIIEGIAARFPDADVSVVAIDENELPEQIATAKAGGTLPDVMQIFYEYIGGYVDQDILDAERATAVATTITDLGGLPLVANPGSTGATDKYGAVPIDGWVQGIWYRTDLFTAAGLEAPDSYENIYTAAETLHDTSDWENPMYGIVIGTHPKAVYTQQVYEHFALANGARALDKDGNIILNNAMQLEALKFYANLSQFAPEGFNDWDAANQLYLTNKTAMMVYSTFIADDILGLQERPWAPLPDLGENTGFQAAIEGKHGDIATYGQLSALGICVGAESKAEDFIKYILNNDNEYLEWIHMAPTGKMPLKQTTGILANWTSHEVWGSYEVGLAESILEGFQNIGRWGLIDGASYSTDIATLYGELIMPKAINKVIANTTSAENALVEAEEEFYAALGKPIPTTGPGTATVTQTETETEVSVTTKQEGAPGFEAAVLLGSFFVLFVFYRRRRK